MLTSKFKNLLSGRLIRNVGWLGIGELINRVFRLATTVTLARVFSQEDYGLMAVIYMTFELVTVFIHRGGVAAKIVQADDHEVAELADTGYWLQWIVCLSLFALQCAASVAIAGFYGNQRLILLLSVAALGYILLPLCSVHIALIERENRLKVTALCNVAQSFLANTVIVTLCLWGMGIWSIVWAIIISQFSWIIIAWRSHTWRPPRKFQLKNWQKIINYSKNIIGIELLNKLRLNLDYLIVGRFLGMDQLGLYFFAFNAGSGITMNVVNTFMSALFPYLCAAKETSQKLRHDYFHSLKTLALIIIPIVILQSALSPLYVPIIFGEKWVGAVPILIIICLSVIPYTFKQAATWLLNAMDRSQVALYVDLIFTVIFGIILLGVVNQGILWVAIAVLSSRSLVSLGFNFWTIKNVFYQKSNSNKLV
ncbi:MAG: lipopolysaccharide biosynthesis protein [Cyanobacteria bacterium P01_E01_bin.35]